MKALLDTHALLSMVSESGNLAHPARAAIADALNELFFSIAGYWEIGIKQSLIRVRDSDYLVGCSTQACRATERASPRDAMANETDAGTVVDRAKGFLGLSLREVRRALGVDMTVAPNDEYGGMPNVISVESNSAFPGTLYLEADEVRLVRINSDGLRGVTRSALRSRMNTVPAQLRSRAGKRAVVMVYASEGIAFSTQGTEIHFIEVFMPCTQREYETRFYRPPGAFIR